MEETWLNREIRVLRNKCANLLHLPRTQQVVSAINREESRQISKLKAQHLMSTLFRVKDIHQMHHQIFKVSQAMKQKCFKMAELQRKRLKCLKL